MHFCNPLHWVMRHGITVLKPQEHQQACNGKTPLHPNQRNSKSWASARKITTTVFFDTEGSPASGFQTTLMKQSTQTYYRTLQMLYMKIKNEHQGKLPNGWLLLLMLHDSARTHMAHGIQNQLHTLQWDVPKHSAYSPRDFHTFLP
jgi:outer membrane receptor for ferric coprogen and ferric-rhodotorulic acid